MSDQASESSSIISTIPVINIRREDILRSDEMISECGDSEYKSEDNCQRLSKSPNATTTRENATQKEIEEDVRNF